VRDRGEQIQQTLVFLYHEAEPRRLGDGENSHQMILPPCVPSAREGRITVDDGKCRLSMRLLFTCFPGYGHASPMVPLARAARRAGHEVLFSSGPDICPWIQSLGFDVAPSGLSAQETHDRYSARFPHSAALPPPERMRLVIPNMFVDIAARARAADLLVLVQDWRPDLIIHEGSELGAPLAAALTSTRHVTHALSLLPLPANWMALQAQAVDALYAEHGIDAGAAVAKDTLYLDIVPPSWHPNGDAFYARVQPLRSEPVDPAPGEALPDRIQALLGEDIVYVSLGTVFNATPGLFEAVLTAVRDLPMHVVITVGPGIDTARFGTMPDHIHLEEFIPQALLLPHCIAMISHAGSGTTAGGLFHAVPQVLLPQGADQLGIAALCAHSGVAMVVSPESAGSDAIQSALHEVLSQPDYRERARSFQAEVMAMPCADDVLARLAREA